MVDYHKTKFYAILEHYKSIYPDLKFKIFKTKYLPSKNFGEYYYSLKAIYIATGGKNAIGKTDWLEHCHTLAHEISHHIRHEKYFLFNASFGNYINGSKNGDKFSLYFTKYTVSVNLKQRMKFASIVAYDEYMTNMLAMKILSQFKVKFDRRDLYREASQYVYILKLAPLLNVEYLRICTDLPRLKTTKMSKKDIFKKIDYKYFQEVIDMVDNGEVLCGKEKLDVDIYEIMEYFGHAN